MASEKNDKNVQIWTVSPKESFSQKIQEGRKRFWHIDKEMIRFKMHYFLFFGAFGTCLPYIPIFAQKRIGISASALAAILMTHRCVCIFSKPFVAYIADYFNKLKFIICTLTVISIVFVLLLLPVPKIEKEIGKDNIDFNSYFSKILNYSEAFVINKSNPNSSSQLVEGILNSSRSDFLCFQSLQLLSDFLNKSFDNTNDQENAGDRIECNIILGNILNNITLSPDFLLRKICCELPEKCQNVDCEKLKASTMGISVDQKPATDFQTYQFWLFGFLTTIITACINNLVTLIDTACCESVEKTSAEFGRQSLWGSIGWGLMSPVSGFLNDFTGDFVASWILMVIISFVCLLNMAKLEMTKPHFSTNLLKDIGTVLSSKEFIAFGFCVLMSGVGNGIIWFYLVLFLIDIGASRFLCGMVMFIQCFFGEIPFMFFSGWVIKKIGHFNTLTLAIAAFVIRFFWYSQLHNPWLVLPAEVLNGITEGLVYTTIVSFAKISAKPGTEATTQALLFTAYTGIGVGIGCVVAGLGFDSIGGHKTFLYVTIYASCALILSIIIHLFVRKQKRCIAISSTNE